ncbi:9507_t:CDS:2, partial [Racocetra fulgida]
GVAVELHVVAIRIFSIYITTASLLRTYKQTIATPINIQYEEMNLDENTEEDAEEEIQVDINQLEIVTS